MKTVKKNYSRNKEGKIFHVFDWTEPKPFYKRREDLGHVI